MFYFKRFFLIVLSIFFLVKPGIAQQYDITAYGAKPDDGINDTEAIQKAIDECAANGGGTVLFPAGTWLSGTIFFKDNISIYLSNGAVWQGVNDSTAFPYIEPKIKSREDKHPRKAMVYGYGLKNIKIHGEGLFYPGGDYEMYATTLDNKKSYFRPFGIYLVKCQNITVSGIRMQHSPFWMQRYFYCDNLFISKLNIYNHSNLNNDGIDIDGCHNVVVSDCIVDASDDAIVLKSEGFRACEDVAITNCILSSHATPLKLGTGSIGGFKRITISNIIIKPSKSDKMIHPLKALGGLGGIDLLNVDGGIMQDITINNVIIDSVETPIFIRMNKRHSGWEGKPMASHGITENISISNVIARNAGPISSSITGYPGHYVKNVTLSNIRITVNGTNNPQDTVSQVEEKAQSYPVSRMYGTNLPSYGFYLRHVENIHLKDIDLGFNGEEYRAGIFMEDVHAVEQTGLKIAQPKGGNKKIIDKN